MERHERLYRLYQRYDAERLREFQDFVDLFPPVDSRVALEYWEEAVEELARRKAELREAFEDDRLPEIAARATRDQAFTALDLHARYGRAVNALVLDVDETLRSAGSTDNEIPRDVLHLLTEFVERDVPLIICTGQTLENVKGFAIQGLGNELVHSGDVSIVYEAGTGVFTPGHGSSTKQLLYEDLDERVREVFDDIRSRVLTEAPPDVRRACHLQGNEFNVTLKPNFEAGSDEAAAIIEDALVYLLDLLGDAVAGEEGGAYARAYYADADPEIAAALDAAGERVSDPDPVPAEVRETFDRIDVAYYHADAAEIGSLELNKVRGVEAALEVLGVDDPFVLVMGDSKTDLRVMEWAAEADAGIAAAPEHASEDVLEHVRDRDDLVFDRGGAASMLRTTYALHALAGEE